MGGSRLTPPAHSGCPWGAPDSAPHPLRVHGEQCEETGPWGAPNSPPCSVVVSMGGQTIWHEGTKGGR